MTLFPMLSEMLEGDHYDVPKTQAKMTKAFIRPYTRRSAQPARKGFSAPAPSYAVPPAVRRLHSSTCGSKRVRRRAHRMPNGGMRCARGGRSCDAYMPLPCVVIAVLQG